MLKVDLHIHTADDPVDRIPYSTPALIERAARLGYDALAITLHERQLDPAPFAAHAAAHGITLIPGIERTIEGRHVLLLNFSDVTETVDSFADLARLKAREPAGLVVAPHPFYPIGTALQSLMDVHAALFDAVERNAMYTATLDFNRRAERWARTHGVPMVGNGDVHRFGQLGSTYSLVEAAACAPDAICAAIRTGRVRVESRPLSWSTALGVAASLVAADLFGIARSELGPRTVRTPNSEV